MKEFRARVSRVRMKDGGADLHIIGREITEDEWRGKIVEQAKRIAELADDDDPLVGYLVIGMYAKGTTASSFRYDKDRCPVPRVLLPAWINEIIRRDVVTGGEAEAVFNEMFE